jgi:hypothetical protein
MRLQNRQNAGSLENYIRFSRFVPFTTNPILTRLRVCITSILHFHYDSDKFQERNYCSESYWSSTLSVRPG